jgi:hypothetical protein
MTAQIMDRFLFKGKEYRLVGGEGGPLISPQDFGMEPGFLHTACWRGFYSTYEIKDDQIFLVEMTMRERKGNYIAINNTMPKVADHQASYEEIYLPVPFTGSLLLAKDFFDQLYVHMGFQEPTSFKTVLELTFKDGRLTDIKDRSKEMAQERETLKQRYESEGLYEEIDEAIS